MPKKGWPSGMTELESRSSEEVARAIAEDLQVAEILRRARAQPARLATESAIREGEKCMSKMRLGSEAAMCRRIKRGEIITKDELLHRLDDNRRWLTAAIRSNRVFSVQSEAGVDYFPAFFADSLERRRTLGKVAKVLAALPGASRYHFFVSKSFVLGMTPREALAHGRLREVLNLAIEFAER